MQEGSDLVYIVVALGALIAIGAVALLRRLLTRRRKGRSPNPYRQLRDQFLGGSPRKFNISMKPGERVWGILYEIGYPDVVASVVALRDGNASLYLSSGGVVIGGFAHEQVRRAAVALVDHLEGAVHSMSAARNPAPPAEGSVQFIVMTVSDTRAVVLRESEAQAGSYATMYEAGQELITQLRLVSENAAREANPSSSRSL